MRFYNFVIAAYAWCRSKNKEPSQFHDKNKVEINNYPV